MSEGCQGLPSRGEEKAALFAKKLHLKEMPVSGMLWGLERAVPKSQLPRKWRRTKKTATSSKGKTPLVKGKPSSSKKGEPSSSKKKPLIKGKVPASYPRKAWTKLWVTTTSKAPWDHGELTSLGPQSQMVRNIWIWLWKPQNTSTPNTKRFCRKSKKDWKRTTLPKKNWSNFPWWKGTIVAL